jgi:hypothetical protein
MHDDLSIAASSRDHSHPPWVLPENIDTVLVTPQSTHKRFGEHPIHLGGGESAGVFAGLGEWVEVGSEVPLDWVWVGRAGGKVVV